MEAAPGNERRRPGHRMRKNRTQVPAFGNWDYDQQHQVPITQYFDYYATKPEPEPEPEPVPVLLHHSNASSVYPHAHSYSHAYTGYADVDHHSPFHGDAVYNHNYDPVPEQHHFDHFNTKTRSVVAAEVKGAQFRRRRSYLGVDNNSKVFDITEAAPVDMCFVVTPDLYDVGFANVATGKDMKTFTKFHRSFYANPCAL